jgi:hypothetical protein
MRILLLCVIILVSISSVFARVINVPDEYATIQAGIDASVNGDTVLVAPGTYTDNPLIENKNIVLQSAGSPENTTIQGYTIIEGTPIDSTCVLQGFKLYRNADFNHDLLEITNASPKIQGNVIEGLLSWPYPQYTGITLSYSNAIIRSNIIKNNLSYYLGHGIQASNSFPIIEANIITRNGGGGAGWDAYGWGITTGSGIVRYNLIFNNGAGSAEGSSGGGISIYGDHFEVTNNTIVANGARGFYTYSAGGLIFSVASNGDRSIIKNNIISLNWNFAGVIGQIQDSNWTGWDYNLVYDNDTIDYRGFQPGPHDLQVDPLFVRPDSGDYHLLPNSPCIDAGDPSFPLDPDSTRADIGAYFFDQNVGIDDPGVPTEPYQLALSQNYPNPFNAQTTISYCLDKPALVSLRICSITGQVVALLSNKETQQAGEHKFIWDGKDRQGGPVSTGIYFYELYVDSDRESKAMILIK